MIDRRGFFTACALLPIIGFAQPARSARVAYLSLAVPNADRSWLQAFKDQLRDLGYIEEKNLALDTRHAHGHAEQLGPLFDELVGLEPDVLVVYGAWHIPKRLNGRTPVVFTVVPDPVAQGVVPSLARPGGNVTGFSDAHSDLVPKRLQLIKEMAPDTRRVGVLYYPSSMTELQLEEARSAAPTQGLTLVPAPVRSSERAEVERAFAAMTAQRATAVLVIAEQTVFTNRKLIAELAIRHREIVISTVREWAEAGFTMAYGTNFHDLWRRSAVYVHKILKGAKPGDLPIEQPTKFDLVINLKSAKAIGLAVPKSLLLRADSVIE